MRAVVTGGAGFIGSNLVDALLLRGDDVLVIDDFSTGKRENLGAKVRVAQHDVRNPFVELLLAHKPDVCFHLAAKVDVNASVAHPEEDAAVNVIGTVNALAAAARAGAKVVFASSGGAIHSQAPDSVTEAAPPIPLSPYGRREPAAAGKPEAIRRPPTDPP